MPSHNARPVRNTITGEVYPSITSATAETGFCRNSIQYWLNKSLSGKPSDWEYVKC
jgi:hypothetical protein